ncbi:chromosome segregation protein SMC [Nocardioidaceae bacterium]|nr:chromosome segregation protein SMC [Nocardioidaceae bacterium]
MTTPIQTSSQTSAPSGLLRDAHDVLERARLEPGTSARLALCQVAAVRAAGAVLASRARPVAVGTRRRQRSVWEVLARRAPELGEWADYLAVPVDLGAAAAGEASPVRVADDRLRDAERFLAAVERVVARQAGRGRGAP